MQVAASVTTRTGRELPPEKAHTKKRTNARDGDQIRGSEKTTKRWCCRGEGGQIPLAKTPTVCGFHCLPHIPPAHRRICTAAVDITNNCVDVIDVDGSVPVLFLADGLGMRRPPKFNKIGEKHVRHVELLCFYPARVLRVSLSRTREQTKQVFSKRNSEDCSNGRSFLIRSTTTYVCVISEA